MAQIQVTSTVHYDHNALELLEFGHDAAELYELVPEWCVEREAIAKRMQQRLRKLLTIKSGTTARRGGAKL